MVSLSLRVLGAGTPYPRPGQPCSGYLVDASGTLLLIEAGLGVWAELLRHTDPARLSGIWISHLHPDHCGDLLAAYQWAANTPGVPRLKVFGPPGWAERLGAALPAEDGPEQLRRLFDVREHAAGTEHVADVALTAVPVQHSVPTFGLRLVRHGVTLAFSADTGPCDPLRSLADGANLFLCEAGATGPGQSFHCAPEDAAHAGRAARRLVLTHLAPELDPADASRRAADAAIATPGAMLHIE